MVQDVTQDITGSTGRLGPIKRVFADAASGARKPLRVPARPADLGWALTLLALAALKPVGPIDPRGVGTMSVLFATLVLLPLVENAIYILAVDLSANRWRARPAVAAGLAALAALLHGAYDAGALFLFAAYFIFAMIYLAWRDIDRSLGFWIGAILHGLLNAPAAIAGFVG